MAMGSIAPAQDNTGTVYRCGLVVIRQELNKHNKCKPKHLKDHPGGCGTSISSLPLALACNQTCGRWLVMMWLMYNTRAGMRQWMKEGGHSIQSNAFAPRH